jgi:hypothetical protein
MTYQGLVKSLVLPAGFRPPTELVHDDLRATVLSRADLEADVRGINDSIELIQRTRGGGWPTEPVTEEVDYVDLVWHELEFREGYSFSYAVYDTAGAYVGCCYLYPVGRRTPLTEQRLAHDVDVSWWVTPAAYDRGHYVALYRALQRWVVESFPFVNPYYSNREIPG